MTETLKKELRNISQVDYIVLGYHLQTANMCRGIMKEFNISDQDMADALSITEYEFTGFKNGAFDYTIMDWAKLQTIQAKYATEALDEKIKSQIGFPDYTHS